LAEQGFNVIGFISANLGLGAAARTTVRLLLENKQPVSVVEVNPGFGRTGKDLSFEHLKQPGGKSAPYSINLIHINPPEFESLFSKQPPWLFDKEKLNVIIPFWELPVVPRSWIHTLERTDLILAPSHFIEHMMATQVKCVPVRHYPQTVIIPQGVVPARSTFGLPEDSVLFVTSFELLSDIDRKNTVAVLDAFSRAFPDKKNVRLVVKVNNPRAHAVFAPHLEMLYGLASRDSRIIVWEKTLLYAEVLSLYASCDVLVSLHRSEGLGLSPLEAMLLGKPVIATAWSGVMDFMNDRNSCLVPYTLVPIPLTSITAYNATYVGGQTVWADPDIESAAVWMRRLAEDGALRQTIGNAAAADMRQRHEQCTRGGVFSSVMRFHANLCESRRDASRPAMRTGVKRPLRVLFQNRANAYDLPGGDTVVMKQLKERLERKGITVDFCGDTTFHNQQSYDLVHLFNLTLPEKTESFAKKAVARNVPFVITTLQEDFCRYYHKAGAAYAWFKKYVPAGEGRRAALPVLGDIFNAAKPVETRTSPFAGKAANMLCACGETEARTLRGLFSHSRISITPFGSSIRDLPAPAALFEQAFGVSDFILCVGRVEPRKNQLMLLLALEKSDLPVVFADGGYSYQPEYSTMCQMFARKGKTIFTGRLSDELLVSAYRASRVHCLPSWYELPGLVSLEAAQYGCIVVASSWGCLPDYLPDGCIWCSPDDPAGIREAVLAGMGKPRDGRAAEQARSFTWDTYGDTMLQQYERVLQEHAGFSPVLIAEAEQTAAYADLPDFIARITMLVEGKHYGDALRFYDEQRKAIDDSAPELEAVDGLMERLRKGLQKCP
jgi:glycosyltransferase involved in cell wall biosynthesis